VISDVAYREIMSIMHDAARDERPAPGHFPNSYRIVIRGELGRRFEGEFHGMTLESRDGKTFLQGALDQSLLHGVLGQIQAYNLEIIEVAEIPRSGRDEGVR
jgi:hypothetical protein